MNTSQNLSDIYSRFVPYAPSNHYASALESNDATLHPVSTTVSLDETEYFTQLCANSVLVKMCTKQGLFTSLVRVFEDTSFRLRRNDLRNSARTKVPWTVWLDGHHNVGVKMRIQERARQVDWVPMMANDSDEDEDSPVSYVVEYEEVLVRTEYLVVVLETAEGQSAKDGVIVGKC